MARSTQKANGRAQTYKAGRSQAGTSQTQTQRGGRQSNDEEEDADMDVDGGNGDEEQQAGGDNVRQSKHRMCI